MIGTILGAVGSIGSAIYGAVKSSELNRTANALLENQINGTRDYYNRRLSEDYMNRSDVQSALTKQRELLDEQYKRARATNAVSGGTDESLALQKEAANKSLSETMGSIASAASSYRDRLEEQYRNEMKSYTQERRGILNAQADAVAQAASQAGSTFLSAGSGIDQLYSDRIAKKLS